MHDPKNYTKVVIQLSDKVIVRKSGGLLNFLLESSTLRRSWVKYLSPEAGRHFIEVSDKVVSGEITSAVLLVKALDVEKFDFTGLGSTTIKVWGFKYSKVGVVHITITELLRALKLVDFGYVRKEFTSRPLRKDMPGYVKPELKSEEPALEPPADNVTRENLESFLQPFSDSNTFTVTGSNSPTPTVVRIDPASMMREGAYTVGYENTVIDYTGLESRYPTPAAHDTTTAESNLNPPDGSPPVTRVAWSSAGPEPRITAVDYSDPRLVAVALPMTPDEVESARADIEAAAREGETPISSDPDEPEV